MSKTKNALTTSPAPDARQVTRTRKTANEQCYLILKTDLEPPDEDDDVSDGNWYFNYSIVAATSKKQALAPQIQKLEAENFWAADEYYWLDAETPQWTDGWTDVTFDVYSIEDENFWEYLGTNHQALTADLVVLARDQKLLAAKLLELARLGNSPGHLALALNPEFLSAIEQQQLLATIKPGDITKADRKSKSL